MRVLSVRLTALAVLVAASVPSAAQQVLSVTPEVRAVIERHEAATGTKKDISSVRATGTISMPAQGITGTVEILSAPPNRMALKAVLGGIGTLESGFDGERGWTIDPIMGPSLLTGKQLDEARLDSAFEERFLDPARYKSLTAAGIETFDGRKAHRIDAVDANGDKSAQYFDVETGLHAGSVSTRQTPMGAVEVTSILRDYRKADGLLQPHTLVQRMMGVEQVVTIDRLEFNVVKADAFALPPAIKALIK